MFVLQNGKWLGQEINVLGFSVVLIVTIDSDCPQPLNATQKPGKDLQLFEH